MMLITSSQAHNRIVDSYLDMNQLVACDPTMLVISDSYFLAGGHITLRAMPLVNSELIFDTQF